MIIAAKLSIFSLLGKSNIIYPTAKCIAKFISCSIIASDLLLICSYGESHYVKYELIFSTMLDIHQPEATQVSIVNQFWECFNGYLPGLVRAISLEEIVFSSLKFKALQTSIMTKSMPW